MTYDCVCDDPPSFYRRSNPRARKAYRCYECSGQILPGEQYENVVGVWEGYFDTFATCERCVDLRVWVKNNVPCLCWAHGNADDDMDTAVRSACWRAPEETRGLRFAFLRRKVMRDRHNKLALAREARRTA